MKKVGDTIPYNKFKLRVKDNSDNLNPTYRWQEYDTTELFKGKKIVLFSLPGAFTPTCSEHQLPEFEQNYDNFMNAGYDEIYCVSVNDSFVMNAWAEKLGIKKVKLLPDGSGIFTRELGMLVDKRNLDFGYRSWRFAMLIHDQIIDKIFLEDGMKNNATEDPYEKSAPANILKSL